MRKSSRVVVKVGGSLFRLPDLRVRLNTFLKSLANARVLLVPGGDGAADVVRAWDRTHGLGEEESHWLALRSLSLTAHFLSLLVPGIPIVVSWHEEPLAILDVHAFARADESQEDHLPHCWEASSDALAARVAQVYQAEQLILLKSVDVKPGSSWEDVAGKGHVDSCFPGVLAACRFPLKVQLVNLRAGDPDP